MERETYSTQNSLQLLRVVDLPIDLRLQRDPRTVRTAALISAAESRGRSPGYRHESRNCQARLGENLRLELGLVICRNGLVVGGRQGVLPREALLGNFRAEIARDGTHVAVGELDCACC